MENRRSSWSLWCVTLRAMVRRLGTSILLAAVIFSGCFTSVLLDRLIKRQEESLQRMIETTRINCIITDPQGMNSDNLNMFAGFVDKLMGYRHEQGCYLDEYVMDVNAISTIPLQSPAGVRLARIMSLASDSKLSDIEGNEVILYEGWSEAVLAGNEKVCIVTENICTYKDENGIEWVNVVKDEKSSADLRVIGTVRGPLENMIYCPFYLSFRDDVTELYRVESCSFTIQDNDRLEESKAAIYEEFLVPNLSNKPESLTYGVIVQDETYLKVLDEIQSNLKMLRLLPPLLSVLTGCIGFFASYMITRTREKEFAVSRCLGMTQGHIFALVFTEQSVLAILGGMAGIGLGFCIERYLSSRAVLKAGLVIAVFLIGAAIATIRVTSVNVMKLMKVED